MNIQYASDLHLERPENREEINKNPLIPSSDVLILAGDILEISPESLSSPFFDYLEKEFKQVFLIPGNHEFYEGFDIADSLPEMDLEIRPNVRMINNKVIRIEDVDFIFSTLWSEITSLSRDVIEYFSDFNYCHFGGKYLTPQSYTRAHKICLQFLKDSFKQKSNKRVVITHHLPSPLCLSDDFKYHHMNQLFYSDLTDLVKSSGAEYWIFGHSHINAAPVRIGSTTMLSNTLGYKNSEMISECTEHTPSISPGLLQLYMDVVN
jgi:DNA repair exonuclease SbcCD nuclease subunit